MDLPSVDREQATLVAATIAAVGSILILLLNLLATRWAELRAAHRQALEPAVSQLGGALYAVVACSTILGRHAAAREGQRPNWVARATEARRDLDDLRFRVRYTLWGLDEGFRVLCRLPDWMQHAAEKPERVERLVTLADRLRSRLDRAIRNSYHRGRPPTLLDRAFVSYHADRLRNYFGESKPTPDENLEEEA